MEFGYALSSEKHNPQALVRFAQLAEEVGFDFALISDHYHPWVDRQGHSPFVWCTIGGIAQVTSRLRLGTGVTCPMSRIHPAVVAQAAATAAIMLLFQLATKTVREEDVTQSIVCGPAVDKYLAAIKRFVDAGYDHVYIHQVGPHQEAFFRFYADQVLPECRRSLAA